MKVRVSLNGFSERLEIAIFNSGLNLNEICRKAEISRSVLWGFRFNGVVPNAGTLVGLCKALNVSADWLLGLKS